MPDIENYEVLMFTVDGLRNGSVPEFSLSACGDCH